jgi:oxygen-dependent protoporphyrinogen oxidase
MVAGVYAGNPDKLSVKHAFPKLWALEQEYGSLIMGQVLGARERRRRDVVSKADAPKFSFDDGLQVLVETLQARLDAEIKLRAPVTQIAFQNGRWAVTIQINGQTERFEHDAVVLTAPAYSLAGLDLQIPKRIDLPILEGIHYPPVASVVLGYRREDISHPLDGFGMLIPEVERFNSLGVLFSSSLFPNRAPAGCVALTCYVGGARSPKSVSLSSQELFQLAHQDISVLLGARKQPVFQHLSIYPKAIPQYEVGYGRFRAFLSGVETQARGLCFAGNYRDGISLGDSIISGHDVADKVLRFL